MTCTLWLLLLVAAVFLMATLMRWFEQTAEAVDNGWWNKVAVLVAAPLAVWLYRSAVSAGRPIPVPRHEPVRGMGGAPARKPVAPEPQATSRASVTTAPVDALSKPVVPAKPRAKSSAQDPELIEKMRRKMREQGLLPPEDPE